MKRLVGTALFLAVLYVVMLLVVPAENLGQNHANLAKRLGLFGIISLGAAMVIIAGGIDLSIGSVVALSATLTGILLMNPYFPFTTTPIPDILRAPGVAIPLVLLMGALIGLMHGLFVAKLRIPSFQVTLCGLFIYRGLARTISGNESKGLADQYEALRDFLYAEPVLGVPRFFIILLVLVALATVFLHFSVWGRYLYAIGSNERAVRYSGIPTHRYKILAFVICSTLASLFGVLFLMEHNSVLPSSDGNFFELYAIAGAVLGGCSLRGGEGTVLGVLIGTTILWLLPNLTNMLGVPSEVEFIVIGGALLVAAVMDEILRPRGAGQVSG
jgi:ribose transport system permease protein